MKSTFPITTPPKGRWTPAAEASPLDQPAVNRIGNAAVSSRVPNLAEAAALVRCSRAHLSNIINGKVHGIPRLPKSDLRPIGRALLEIRRSLPHRPGQHVTKLCRRSRVAAATGGHPQCAIVWP